MEIDIIEEDENPMLHRTDVRFQIKHDEATPSRLSVRDSLAAKLNKDSAEVVVHEAEAADDQLASKAEPGKPAIQIS